MKIQIVRVLDNVPVCEMVIATSLTELSRGFLTYDDALEIAGDIVHTAGECYDTGTSPWKISIDNTPSTPAALLVGEAVNKLRDLREREESTLEDVLDVLDEVEMDLERVLDAMGVVTYGKEAR